MLIPKSKLKPIPPGQILLEEFIKPNGLSQNQLARDLDINPAGINDIVHGRSAVTATVALRLGKYFATSAEFWLNLQTANDLRKARAETWPKIAARVRTLGTAKNASIAETLYLLRSRKNAARLRASIRQAESGRLIRREPTRRGAGR